MKAFDEVLMKRYKNKVVTFINHSVTKGEDPSRSGPRRSKHLYSAKTWEIPMPNEKFILLLEGFPRLPGMVSRLRFR